MSTPHLLVISHPRSGTHLAIDTIRHNFDAYDQPYLNLDRLTRRHDDPLPVRTLQDALSEGPRIVKSHMHTDVAGFFEHRTAVVAFVEELMDDAALLYVCRDGRDVMTSLYYYMKSYNDALAGVPFRTFLRQPNDHDGDTYDGDLSRVEYWREHVSGWLARPDALPLPFHTLRYCPRQAVAHLGDSLGQSLPETITDVVRTPVLGTNRLWWLRAVDKLGKLWARYVRRTEYTSTLFRSGTSGDYEEHFDAEDLAYFDRLAGETLRAVHALSDCEAT